MPHTDIIAQALDSQIPNFLTPMQPLISLRTGHCLEPRLLYLLRQSWDEKRMGQWQRSKIPYSGQKESTLL